MEICVFCAHNIVAAGEGVEGAVSERAEIGKEKVEVLCDCDIAINVCSDAIFVVLLALVLFALSRIGLVQARRFFGFTRREKLKIYVSGHEDKNTLTKQVVTALEYEAAVELRDALQKIGGGKAIRELTTFTAGLIGQAPRYPEPAIEVSPLEQINEALPGALILIGGPLRNQVTKFYQEKSPKPLIKFDNKTYLVLENGEYQRMSNVVASIERRVIDRQVVITAFGLGENHTQLAVRYLISNWKDLHKNYPGQDIGVLLFADSNSNYGKWVEKRTTGW